MRPGCTKASCWGNPVWQWQGELLKAGYTVNFRKVAISWHVWRWSTYFWAKMMNLVFCWMSQEHPTPNTIRSRLADNTACAYDFGWHDFHASGHGTFNGPVLSFCQSQFPDNHRISLNCLFWDSRTLLYQVNNPLFWRVQWFSGFQYQEPRTTNWRQCQTEGNSLWEVGSAQLQLPWSKSTILSTRGMWTPKSSRTWWF